MQRNVEAYKCEWKEVVYDEELQKKFHQYVNTNETQDTESSAIQPPTICQTSRVQLLFPRRRRRKAGSGTLSGRLETSRRLEVSQ